VIIQCFDCKEKISRVEGDCTEHFGYEDENHVMYCEREFGKPHAPTEEIRTRVIQCMTKPCGDVEVHIFESQKEVIDFLRTLNSQAHLVHLESELESMVESLELYYAYTGLYPQQIVHLADCKACVFDKNERKFLKKCEALPEFKD
jgi:hypothetical protein